MDVDTDTHPISSELRAALFSVWGGKCAYCDAAAEHVDHIHPKARGGLDHIENYAPACRRCNLRKSATILEVPYVGIVQQMAKRRAAKVLKLIDRPSRAASRKRMIHNIKNVITVVDLDLPDFAIAWTAKQVPSGIPHIGAGGQYLGEVGCLIMCDGRSDIMAAYQNARPEWRGPVGGGPLVTHGPKPGYPQIFIDPKLIVAATIAHKLGVASFEFDGTVMPTSARRCRPASITAPACP